MNIGPLTNKYLSESFIGSLVLINLFCAYLSIGDGAIPIVFPFFIVFFFVGLLSRFVVSDLKLLFLYFVCAIFAGFSYFLAIDSEYVSFSSLLYFIVLYFPFAFISSYKSVRFTDFFVKCIAIISAFAIYQFFSQTFGLGFYYIVDFIPDDLRLNGYAGLYEYPYGSGYFKPNGFFLLEPSFLSQFVALGIVVEFCFRRRLFYIATFLFALILSKSGTGIIILVFFIGYYFYDSNWTSRLIGLFVLVATVIFSAIFIDSDFYLGRAAEFSVEGSSGFIRFVAPFINVYDLFERGGVGEFVFGFGPGAATRLYFSAEANYIFFAKSIIEYGVIFTLLVHWFLLAFLIKSINRQFVFPIIAFVFLASGAMLQPLTIVMVYLFQFMHAKNSIRA